METNDLSENWSWRSTAYAWWVVIVLALALTLSLMDRMIIALMITPIQRDLNLSDTQISLVHGFAFTILYVFAGFPLGRIADSGNRKILAAMSVFAWSGMTALCGAANNFIQLFLTRMGVGVGEAGLSPAAVSMISDYFPKQERARPLAFLTIGTTAGAGIALMIGGSIVQMIGNADSVTLPVLGEVRAWQAVFITLGLGGIAFAALFATVREPPRSERAGTATLPSPAEVGRHITTRKKFFIPQFLSPALAVLVLIGFHSWVPTMLLRKFGWSTVEAGYLYGALIATGGITGILIAGWLSVAFNRRTGENSELHIVRWAVIGSMPFLVAAPMMPSGMATILIAFPGIALLTIPAALAPVILQSVTPNEMRGQIFAVHLFVLSLLGYAAGPFVVAAITDSVLHDQQKLYVSLSAVAAFGLPLSALCAWLAHRNASAVTR